MFVNYLRSIEGVGIYPLFSLLVFFVFFVVVVIRLVKMDKNYIKKMSNLPLDVNYNEENSFIQINGENNIED